MLKTLALNNSIQKITSNISDIANEELDELVKKIEENNFSIMEINIEKYIDAERYNSDISIRLQSICQRNKGIMINERKNILSIFAIIFTM